MKQQADRCQGPEWEDPGPPAAELARVGVGRLVGGRFGESDMPAEIESTTESSPSFTPKMKHFYNTILKNLTFGNFF